MVDVTDFVGECSRCGIKMKLSKCQLKETAKVLVRSDTGSECRIMLFSEQLESLIVNKVGSTISDKLFSIDCIIQQ